MALNSGFSITGLTIISKGSGFGADASGTLIANDVGHGSGFTGTWASNPSGEIIVNPVILNPLFRAIFLNQYF
jgi:hypothetical protein